MYKKVKLTEMDGIEDEPQDVMGFLGLASWMREKKVLKPITESEFIKLFMQNIKLKEVMLSIKEIDKDKNGYVTRTELDDIIKLHYKESLSDRNLTPIINKFSSISNKILIDYKAFRDWLKEMQMRTEIKDKLSQTAKQSERALSQSSKVNHRNSR
jgi:hypothetical protein